MGILLQRKQKIKTLTLRLLFVSGVLLIIYFLSNGIVDYAIFSSLIFIFLLFPTITEIIVLTDQVEFNRYYLMATLKRTSVLSPKNIIKINTFEAEIEADTDAYILSESIWSFLPVFLTPKTTLKYYRFIYLDKKAEKKMDVRLTEIEYKQITDVLNS